MSQLSENLTGLFGFPKIYSSSKIEPKFQAASNSISKEDLFFNLTKSSNPKESRKHPLTSPLVQNEFTKDLVTIKIESKNLVDDTSLNDDELSDLNVLSDWDDDDVCCGTDC